MTATIMIVDDEIDIWEYIQIQFRKQIKSKIYEFLFAKDGEDALNLLKTNSQTDMVITDLNMAGMDGLTLLKHIQEQFPRLKSIVVSAFGDMDNVRRSMNLGAYDFLPKPMNMKNLPAVIEKTLQAIAKEQEQLEEQIEAEMMLAHRHPNQIHRTITPPFMSKQIVSGLLNYFGELLHHKFPDRLNKIQVEQDDQTLTLRVEAQTEDHERIETLLDHYAMILQGRISPEEVFDSPLPVNGIKLQLRLAHLQMENQKELWLQTQSPSDSQDKESESESESDTTPDFKLDPLFDLIASHLSKPMN